MVTFRMVSAVLATLAVIGCTPILPSDRRVPPVAPTPSPSTPTASGSRPPINSSISQWPATDDQKRTISAAFQAMLALDASEQRSRDVEAALIAASASDAAAALPPGAVPAPFPTPRPRTGIADDVWTQGRRSQDNGDGTVTVTEADALNSFLVDLDQTTVRTFAKSAPNVTLTLKEQRRFVQDNCIGLDLNRTKTQAANGYAVAVNLSWIECGDRVVWTLALNGDQGTLRVDGRDLAVVRQKAGEGGTITVTDATLGTAVVATYDAQGRLQADSVEARVGGTKVGKMDSTFGGVPGAPMPPRSR